MVELLRKMGPNSYQFNYIAFIGDNEEWMLIGTICDLKGESGDSLDEYKSKSGKYMEVLRSRMYREQLKGKITPIITMPSMGPKPYNSKEKKKFFG
ncbi:hypothetical protein DBR40_05430 [Pedobacter sp. KBW01]|uniref:hypothetical protein n=1 Tax=Pedobacter sp. KBW01 TaxID=2153364 RepID=UPI000F5947DA|nr:hypothetical protein [Pedobacter sp. KBW01]RQO79161.1 hypothetical protein DBR40_05430 [Pedobacter sp. KBW01]